MPAERAPEDSKIGVSYWLFRNSIKTHLLESKQKKEPAGKDAQRVPAERAPEDAKIGVSY